RDVVVNGVLGEERSQLGGPSVVGPRCAEPTHHLDGALHLVPPGVGVSVNDLAWGAMFRADRHRSASRVRSRLTAALMRARWVKACGKLPRASPVIEVSSANRPRWF